VKATLRVQKLDRPELVAYDRILKRYGAGCYPQEPQEKEDHWKVPIGAFLESRIVDEKANRERILTFNLQNVGEILVRKSTMRVMAATRLGTLGRKILKKRVEISRMVEQDLIKVFGKPDMKLRFSLLRFSLTGLQPIYRTLYLLLLGTPPSYDEMMRVGPHYPEQVELIVELDYAEYTENNMLVPTNKLKELYSREKGDMERTIDIVLGLVLSTFYYNLRKKMRVAQFVPYVRASTSYYGDAIQFGKLISISENRLRDNVRGYYRGIPLPRRVSYAYPVMIKELVNAKILDYDGDYITGRANIFEKLIDIRNALPMSEEPVSFG